MPSRARLDADLATKTGRSRRLPITDEVVEILAAVNTPPAHSAVLPGATLFFSSTGNQVSPASGGVIFNQICDAAALARPAGGPQPRPYAFRHHFDYANLHRWMRQGRDASAMLPHLARYMGHAGIESTFSTCTPHRTSWPTTPASPRTAGRCCRGGMAMKRHSRTDAPDPFSIARDHLHTYLPTARGASPKTIQAYRISLESYLHYQHHPDVLRLRHHGHDAIGHQAATPASTPPPSP